MFYEGSCVQFIRCINGRGTQQACQNGLHFNNATQQCDLPENVGCEIQVSYFFLRWHHTYYFRDYILERFYLVLKTESDTITFYL